MLTKLFTFFYFILNMVNCLKTEASLIVSQAKYKGKKIRSARENNDIITFYKIAPALNIHRSKKAKMKEL